MKTVTLNLILSGIILLVLIGYLTSFERKARCNRIPKIIWTYWDDPDKVPEVVKHCRKSWAKSNPNYKIILLDKNNFKNYVSIPQNLLEHVNFHDNNTRLSDLIRAWALAEHGGVWIDGSVALNAPLDHWLFSKDAEFSGFYIERLTFNMNYPIIENWFFACQKGSPFMKKWRDEFSKLSEFADVDKYLESRKEMGVDVQNIGDPTYLAMNVAAQKILQIDKYPINNLILRRAEDGPFKYLADSEWDAEKGLDLACRDHSYKIPILKMRSDERKILDKRKDLTPEKCGWSH